jgi:hypothetical protein
MGTRAGSEEPETVGPDMESRLAVLPTAPEEMEAPEEMDPEKEAVLVAGNACGLIRSHQLRSRRCSMQEPRSVAPRKQISMGRFRRVRAGRGLSDGVCVIGPSHAGSYCRR